MGNEIATNPEAEGVNHPGKRTYTTPELSEFGKVALVTRGFETPGPDAIAIGTIPI